MSNQCPNGWNSTTLLDVSEKVKAGPFGSAITKSMYVADGFKVYGQEQVIAGDISIGSYFISEEKFEELSSFSVQEGDILMSCVGTFGKTLLVPEKHKQGIINPRLILVRLKDDFCPLFVQYLLSSSLVQDQLLSCLGGGTMGVINATMLKRLSLRTPPLPEQKKIAEILSGIDNLVRSLTEHNQKLEATKTALSKELISGHSGHRKESPYGQIPEHWIESTLGGIIGMANLQTGPFGSQLHAHEYTTEGIPVVMPQDMRKCGVVTDKIARITPDRAQTLEKHKVSPGDILFSRRGDIGRHAIISTNESGWICGTGCLRARTDGAINPIFLSELLRHKYALEWLNANAVGQTMLNLNTGILADLPVVVPPADEQEKIANSLSSINEQTRKIANKIWHTQNLKAAVASDLLSGRKRVSV